MSMFGFWGGAATAGSAGRCCWHVTVVALKAGPADAAEGGVTDEFVAPALACPVTVLAPVALGAELLAARAGVASAALAAAIDRVAGRLVVAVALVCAIRPECPHLTRLFTVFPHPAARAAALPVHVVALPIVLAVALAQAPPAVGATVARL